MGDDEGTQPLRRHRDMRNVRDAGGTQQPANGQQRDKQASQPGQDWQELIGLLKEIKDNLTKEEEVSPRYQILTMVGKAARRVNVLQKRYGEHITQSDSTKTQLDRIEAGINEIRQKGIPPNPGAPPAQGRSWAAVAAQAAHTAKAIATPQRTTVRVRLEESQGREPGELLEIIKKTIPSTYAVRTLRSGDVYVHVPSQAIKD